MLRIVLCIAMVVAVVVCERAADYQRRGPGRPARVDDNGGNRRRGRGKGSPGDRFCLGERRLNQVIRMRTWGIGRCGRGR